MPVAAKVATLHQRHKSTGNLAGPMAGFRAAAKRTAFGDVSNIAKALSIKARGDGGPAAKIFKIHQDGDGVTVLPKLADPITVIKNDENRPPVDPVANAGHEVSVDNLNFKPILNAAAPAYVPTALPLAAATQPAKKKTAIYVDVEPAADPMQQVIIDTVEPVVEQIIEEEEEVKPVEARTSRKSSMMVGRHYLTHLDCPAAEFVVHNPEFRSLIDNLIAHQTCDDECYHVQMKRLGLPYDFDLSQLPQPDFGPRHFGLKMHEAFDDERYEGEEYTDELIDDPTYAFSTLHTVLSGGDHTTGGICDVVIPKYTRRVLRELARAKEITLAGRPPIESDEECFDISMAAEYGDEIFEYMYALEVGRSALACWKRFVLIKVASSAPRLPLHGCPA